MSVIMQKFMGLSKFSVQHSTTPHCTSYVWYLVESIWGETEKTSFSGHRLFAGQFGTYRLRS
jgi:hypothetical protein